MGLNFTFNVGKAETHDIDFHFNQFWGNLEIMVDGKSIKNTIRFLSFSLTKTYEFDVGINEIHNIRIDVIRKLFLADFREYNAEVYVDGKLMHKYSGNATRDEISNR